MESSKAPTVTTIVIAVIVVAALIWIGVNRNRQTDTAPTSSTADQESTEPAMAKPINIGWLGPLTGDAANYGASIKRGVELAEQDTGSELISITFEDSKCEAKDAVSAFNKLLSSNQVQAVIGEVCSGASLAIAPIAESSQVVLISAASTSPNISEAGSFIFRTVPSDVLQGAFGADLVSKDGHESLAILYSNEEYGFRFNNVLADSFTGEVVAQEAFERTSVDMRTQLTKIKNANPDALYIISNSPDSAIAALKQAAQLGLTAAIYGSEGLKSPDVIDGAGTAAEDMIVTAVSSGSSEFIARHKQAFGESPGPFAAQAYDAYIALVRAIERGADIGPRIRDELTTVEFAGASGYVQFDQNGDVSGNYDVLIVKDGELVSPNQATGESLPIDQPRATVTPHNS